MKYNFDIFLTWTKSNVDESYIANDGNILKTPGELPITISNCGENFFKESFELN